MPKVSVIVPVYNVEPYLDVCINSILVQTLTDLEIICVDDGSTDNSSLILDAYAIKDSRVRVIHRENHGYGQSINVGMDMAKGEYIGIVESDDCILPDMYEKLYYTAKTYDLDFVKSDCIFWWDTLKYTNVYHKDDLNDYYDRVLDSSYRRIFFNFFMNIWTGIYKKRFLDQNEIRCNETPGASYQDNGFWIQTMSFAEKAMWLGIAFYMYRQDNPDSSIKRKDKVIAMREEYDFAEKILEQRHKQSELNICHYFRMIRHKGTFIRIADELKRDYCEEIIKDFGKYKDLMIHNKEVYKWLQRLCESPDIFCNEFISRKAMVLNELEKAETIIIYGAGKLGQKTLRILNYQNMSNKILCFAISDQTSTGHVGTIPIYYIEDLTEYRERTIVIIGANEGSKNYNQMKQRLEKLNFAHVLSLHLLMRYFYYLC